LGTLISNVLAGFIIGFVIGLEQNSVRIPQNTKLFLKTGLFGGLSTFSTFSIETVELLKAGTLVTAIVYIASNLGFSLCGVIAGQLSARTVCGLLR